jgi:hypothetical protein
MTEMFNSVGPVIQNYAMATGDITPLNNLIADMAKSRSLDPSRYALQSAPPPPPAAPQPPGEPAGSQNQPGDGAPS